jgi:lipoyl-dependent peroxiredoxin
MKRKATAIWLGGGKDGKGTLTTQSTVINKAQYSFSSRFEQGIGTNPEELIAAAHGGCFAMKLSFVIGEAGFTPQELNVECTITLGDGIITNSHLVLKAKVPGMPKDKFDTAVAFAKANCPISKSLNPSINVTVDASLG